MQLRSPCHTGKEGRKERLAIRGLLCYDDGLLYEGESGCVAMDGKSIKTAGRNLRCRKSRSGHEHRVVANLATSLVSSNVVSVSEGLGVCACACVCLS